MTRVGIIGAGLMGTTHARLLATSVTGAEVVALADPDRAAAERLAHEIGAHVVYDDALELIAAADVEAVIVASPVSTHEPYTLACLHAGKRVLCEKPLTATPEAAYRIVEADPHGLVTTGFMRRYDPGYAALKARLDDGSIGAPLLVHCAHRNPFVHEFFDSAMIITDTAVHEVDVARWLLGEEIVRATVHTPRPTSKARAGLLDPQLLVFETESGRIVDVEAFVTAGFAYDIRCEVVGETGTLELQAPATVVTRTDFAQTRPLPPDFQQRFATAYLLELHAWIAGAPGPTAYDGYAAAAVCQAAVEALQTGEPTEVHLAPAPS
jgi:myo-inositol 2-dehydrogenase / D-chiro-inositol 1-dehydrogenase